MADRDRNRLTGKLRRVWALIVKESRQIIRDPSSIAIGVVMPMMLILLFGVKPYGPSASCRKTTALKLSYRQVRATPPR